MIYLLDTNILVNFLRGREGAKKILIALSKQGSFAISVITYGELLYGAHKSTAYQKEKERIRQLVDDFRIVVFPLNAPVMEVYAGAKSGLEQSGNMLDDFDLLIGATAVTSQSMLVTENIRHFQRFPGIELAK